MQRILVVEDDAQAQQFFRHVLESKGFEASLCATGLAALEIARREKPDLLLLDVNLPDLSGLEVCRRLKADKATGHIPVLMITGVALDVGSKVSGLKVGAEDYLCKPVDKAVLVSRIRALLKLTTKPS